MIISQLMFSISLGFMAGIATLTLTVQSRGNFSSVGSVAFWVFAYAFSICSGLITMSAALYITGVTR